jgi:hypothetical protein
MKIRRGNRLDIAESGGKLMRKTKQNTADGKIQCASQKTWAIQNIVANDSTVYL